MDYTSTPLAATFTAGTNSTTINIPVNMDNIAEESETFNLSLTIPPSLSERGITLGVNSAATATITDNTSKYCYVMNKIM